MKQELQAKRKIVKNISESLNQVEEEIKRGKEMKELMKGVISIMIEKKNNRHHTIFNFP